MEAAPSTSSRPCRPIRPDVTRPLARRLILGAGLAAIAGPAAASAGLRIGGTGMALGIVDALLGALAQQPEAPLAMPSLFPSLGTSGGLAALRAGRLDLALTARDLRPAEAAEGFGALAFARTPIGFATRADTRASALTQDEAAAMLAGDMPRWPAGGQVRLVRRDRSETDWLMLAALSPRLAAAVERALARPGLATAGSDQDNADLLENLPGSLGLISLGQAVAERRPLRMLPLDGQAPTVEAVVAGHYPLVRTLFAVARADAGPAVRQFLDFIQSPAAVPVLYRNGYTRPPGVRA